MPQYCLPRDRKYAGRSWVCYRKKVFLLDLKKNKAKVVFPQWAMAC